MEQPIRLLQYNLHFLSNFNSFFIKLLFTQCRNKSFNRKKEKFLIVDHNFIIFKVNKDYLREVLVLFQDHLIGLALTDLIALESSHYLYLIQKELDDCQLNVLIRILDTK